MPRARVLLTAAFLGVSLGPAITTLGPHTAHTGPLLLANRSDAAALAPELSMPAGTTTTTPTTIAPPAPPAKAAPRRVQPAGDGKTNTNKPDTRAKPAASGVALGMPFVGKFDGPEIEGYARYEAQSTCDPAAKPGTVAIRDLLLSRYPNTTSSGISRSCETEGVSEHEEGRAFDWGANVNNAAQHAAVDDFLTALLATDKYGHPHALARRMGVMYVIWNHQIWGAYQADAGWRPYDGSSPHTDHVHISMSWAGARLETSFWSGHVVPGLPDGTRPPRPDITTPTTRRDRRHATTTTTRPAASTTTSTVASTTTTSVVGTTTTRRHW